MEAAVAADANDAKMVDATEAAVAADAAAVEAGVNRDSVGLLNMITVRMDAMSFSRSERETTVSNGNPNRKVARVVLRNETPAILVVPEAP